MYPVTVWRMTEEFLQDVSGQMSRLNSLEKEEKETPEVQKELNRLRSIARMIGDKRWELVTKKEVIDKVTTYEEQLEAWLHGYSMHCFDETAPGDTTNGKCCPDFSCCNSRMFTEYHERWTFMRLFRQGNYMNMLMGFLTKAFSSESDAKIHIAGEGHELQRTH